VFNTKDMSKALKSGSMGNLNDKSIPASKKPVPKKTIAKVRAETKKAVESSAQVLQQHKLTVRNEKNKEIQRYINAIVDSKKQEQVKLVTITEKPTTIIIPTLPYQSLGVLE